MRILFVGDVVGKTGRTAIARHLPHMIRDWSLDLVIVNGENSAGGFGITEAIYLRLQLPMPQPAEVSLLHEADEMALAVEARELMGDPDWPGLRNADGYTLDAQTQWAFEVAARQYEAQVVAMSRTCRHERRRRLGHNGGA